MKLGEILEAICWEFGQLTPPQAITDPYVARLLPDLWERAKAATFKADDAMADLAGIVAHWTEITAATPTTSVASADGSGEANSEG
jgi:hypothetical protein